MGLRHWDKLALLFTKQQPLSMQPNVSITTQNSAICLNATQHSQQRSVSLYCGKRKIYSLPIVLSSPDRNFFLLLGLFQMGRKRNVPRSDTSQWLPLSTAPPPRLRRIFETNAGTRAASRVKERSKKKARKEKREAKNSEQSERGCERERERETEAGLGRDLT